MLRARLFALVLVSLSWGVACGPVPACLPGLRFPQNFNSPYKSANIIDFWKRWHITLSRFITNYLYTPILWSFRNPDYPALNVQMARLLVERGQPAAARDHLLAANRQDPFDPEIHAGLAAVHEATGDAAAAERENKFARLLSGH